MSSTTSKMKDSVTDAIHKCIFCNKMLDGQSVILKCLHIACKNCLMMKITDSGVQCICLETTNEAFKDYPLVSPGISSIRVCCYIKCTNKANTFCSMCKKVYCKPCFKEHPCFKENQGVHIIRSYPMTKDLAVCPSCNKKCVEVFCTKCSVMICSLCHLSSHRKHKYELLENYGNVIKSSLLTQKLSLEKSNLYLRYCLDKTENQIKNLEIKKISVYEDIDREMEILIEEINKRRIELKNSVDINVAEIVSAANENKNIFEDLHKKNKYYIALTEYILNHGNLSDLVHLSNIVSDKTMLAKNHTAIVSKNVSSIKIDLNFDNKNTENCISSIKEVGDIVACKVLSVCNSISSAESPINVFQPSEIQVNEPINVDEVESNSDLEIITSDDSSETLFECNACNHWAVILTQCNSCNRYYHNSCHIPPLQDPVNNKTLANWTCTLCKDITKYSKGFVDLCVTNNTPLKLDGKKVMQRVLLELFCQNEDSEHFRECPDRTDYPLYYEKVTNPICLNDVKTRLVCDDSYMKLFDVIKDLKLIFSNAMQYYSQFDPYYASARNLQINLNKMLAKWLPKMDLK